MTIPLSTLACTIDATGISAPSYADILATLQYQYRSIYGSDVDLDADTQDGQWLGILAAGFNDANNACINVWNQFSPGTAVGAGLSSVVKVNGITRLTASNSTADLTIVGQANTVVINGQVSDGANVWALPLTVTIPGGGSVVATATCTSPGAITAAAGDVSQIVNPQRGWQSAANATEATVGAPVESDAALRQRQSVSTALSAVTPLQAVTAAVENVAGVTSVTPYENDTGSTDANGLPRNSISLVVSGGDATAICVAIAGKKNLGTGTYGTTSETVMDPAGVPRTINFFRPTIKRVIATLTITPLAGYVSTTSAAIQDALVAAVKALPTGYTGGVAVNDLLAAAELAAPQGLTYKIEPGALLIALFGNSPANADIALTFNQQASLSASDIVISP